MTRKKPRQNHQRGSAHPKQREREKGLTFKWVSLRLPSEQSFSMRAGVPTATWTTDRCKNETCSGTFMCLEKSFPNCPEESQNREANVSLEVSVLASEHRSLRTLADRLRSARSFRTAMHRSALGHKMTHRGAPLSQRRDISFFQLGCAWQICLTRLFGPPSAGGRRLRFPSSIASSVGKAVSPPPSAM